MVHTQVVAGDEFLKTNGIEHVDVIKIDVEGWELNVLAGLEKTIARSKDIAIFCEFNPVAQECAGRSRNELFEWFLDRQFILGYPDGEQLRRLSQDSIEQFAKNLRPGGYATIFASRESASLLL